MRRTVVHELLMAPPTWYGVEYEINPWMSRARQPDHAAATEQWQALYRLLTGELGARVHLVEPVPGLPDLVFTANAGLTRDGRAVLANFRHAERQREAPHFRRWFVEHGFQVVELPEDRRFEGEGDALFMGETLYCGYRYRTDAAAHRMVGEALGVRALPLELTEPRFYHLDTCFCPLAPDLAAWYPPAFDEYARRVLATHVPRLLEVSEAEAVRFACNAVVLGNDVVLNTGCPELESTLRSLGYRPHSTPLDEFLKAGGSAKCLVLHLRRGAPRS
jgi:N-dimethylarginine dimethylaminohydrolase